MQDISDLFAFIVTYFLFIGIFEECETKFINIFPYIVSFIKAL